MKKKPTSIQSKPKPQTSLNPVQLDLTKAELSVYKIIKGRHDKKKTTTSGDIANAWGDKDRSWIWRKLQVLIEKDLIECYSRNFYRLK